MTRYISTNTVELAYPSSVLPELLGYSNLLQIPLNFVYISLRNSYKLTRINRTEPNRTPALSNQISRLTGGKKEFLSTLLLAPGGELIISGLSPPRFFSQYWRPIQNDPDALIFAFPTIMIDTGLKVLESLLSISIRNYSSQSSMWRWRSG